MWWEVSREEICMVDCSFCFVCDAVLACFTSGRSAGIPGCAPYHADVAQAEESFRILLGLTDPKATRWDGSLSVNVGEVVRLEPWRFEEGDALQREASGWKLSTRTFKLMTFASRLFWPDPNPVVANGVVATFGQLRPESTVEVKTAQGNFQFRPAELSYGSAVKLLGGRVMVDRVPSSQPVVQPPGDHDYPAAASDREGNVLGGLHEVHAKPEILGYPFGVVRADQGL